ncbi:metabotropic glutamate receptor 5-like isoform X2 [Plodia interpunctella]|uniref:metabotropic glutamate receptor 5-like isoform X2 n=1 Tax=Plodia interpunctella TaxID=58824 RepID=UPI0023685D91|nr:metabotropic glutamate receptor 5-like isoform X2 [Plodia interpunctella]
MMLMLLALLAALGEAGGAGVVRTRAEVRGAVRFGALFAVHGAPAAAVAGARCGAVREHYGIQRVEATLRALDAINADAHLLRGLRLGAELRDSCWAAPTALRQTIELVRDAIAPHDHARHDRSCEPPTGRSSNSEAPTASSTPLLGVLGPGASAAAVQVQNLLQLFSIPQVSYSATSRELSDRARFSTFFRMVPSDQHQARLLVRLLRAHNWTYVHAVHTDESYGQSGMAAFREEAARGGVCVAREEALRAAPSEQEVDGVLQRLAAGGSHVAVCWCEGRTARALLLGLQRRTELAQASGQPAPVLRLVGSDGWADRRDVVAGVEPAARLALTLRIRSPYLHDFDRYYHALTPHNNKRNPWFQEFWEQKFNCSLDDKPPAGTRQCTGSESLANSYTQEPKLALVVRGVYAFAHALHDMRRGLCPRSLEEPLCPAMLPFNVSLYRWHLAKVRFRAPDGGLVAFDENGDPPPELSEYDVMNLVSDGAGGWRYVRVGRWRRGALQLRGGVQAAARRAAGVRAACGATCGAGQWARAGQGRARCCWTCETCAPLAIVASSPNNGCRLCPPGHRPDFTRTQCLPSPIEWGSGGRWARSVAACAGTAGLMAVAICGVTFWRHRNTPVVKSASRELCALLLCAATACHVAALAAASRPAALPCAAVRVAAPALGGVYAAILARTLRVARLVAAVERRPTSRPRLLSSRAQVRTRRLPHNLNETRFVGAAAYATGVTWLAFFPLYAASEARTATLGACASLSAGACVLLSLGPRVFICVFRPARNTRHHFLTATSIRCHLGKYRPDSQPATAACATSPPKQRASSSRAVQTDSPGADARCSEESCAAAGACARVRRVPACGDDELSDVLIVLLQHHHSLPAGVSLH